jgi:hypothetical protein
MTTTNYKHLYQKYKNKYLNLKELMGGARLFYQPCEINRLTSGLFINNTVFFDPKMKLYEVLSSHTDEEGTPQYQVPIITNGGAEYSQDPAIFLKRIRDANNENYAIRIRNDIDFSGFNNVYDSPSYNVNDYGGNFITSPEITAAHPYGTIFCFQGLTDNLKNILESNCAQNLIQLSCSFNNQGDRHIDECMCFMPYGGNGFKVWMYYIRNITYSNQVQQMMSPCDIEKVNEKLRFFLTDPSSTEEFSTWANYILNGRIREIPDISLRKFMRRFMPFEEACLKKYYLPDERIARVSNLDNLRAELEAERQANIELVAQNVFSNNYNYVMDRFVFFPLDLEIDFDNVGPINYRITNTPIFNRVWYETDSEVKLLFPIREVIDPEVSQIMEAEAPYVASMINPSKPITPYFINTHNYGIKGRVGGNLHCLIKSVL